MNKNLKIIGIVILAIGLISQNLLAAEDLESYLAEPIKAWNEVSESDYFFADNIYGSLSIILSQIFVDIYDAFLFEYKAFARGLFGLAMTIYLIAGFTGKLEQTKEKIIRTLVLSLLTFEVTMNIAVFEEWILKFFFNFPYNVQQFFFSIPMKHLANVENLNSDNIYLEIISQLWRMAKEQGTGVFSISVAGLAMSAFCVVVIGIMYIFYLAFWIVQFNFLFSLFMYMVIGIPVLFLASFSFSKQIFVEWIRGMFTISLYPVFSTLIIFIVNNYLYYVALDMQTNVVKDEVAPVPVVACIVIIALGFTFLKNVPNFAASITRGTGTSGIDAGSPISLGRSMVGSVAGVAGAGIGARLKGEQGKLFMSGRERAMYEGSKMLTRATGAIANSAFSAGSNIGNAIVRPRDTMMEAGRTAIARRSSIDMSKVNNPVQEGPKGLKEGSREKSKSSIIGQIKPETMEKIRGASAGSNKGEQKISNKQNNQTNSTNRQGDQNDDNSFVRSTIDEEKAHRAKESGDNFQDNKFESKSNDKTENQSQQVSVGGQRLSENLIKGGDTKKEGSSSETIHSNITNKNQKLENKKGSYHEFNKDNSQKRKKTKKDFKIQK